MTKLPRLLKLALQNRKPRCFTAMASLSVLALLSLTVRSSTAQEISIATSAAGTVGSVFAHKLAQQLKPEKINLTVIEQPVLADRLRLLIETKVHFALLPSDLAFLAWSGQGPFSQRPAKDLRGIAVIYPLQLHILGLKPKGIIKLSDLKDKTIAIGTVDPTTDLVFRDVFTLENLSFPESFKGVLRRPLADTIAMAQAGIADAGVFFALAPNERVSALLTQKDVFHLIPMLQERTRRIYNKIPYLSCYQLSPDIYRVLDKPIPTVGLQVSVVSRLDVPSDIVNRVTKTLFEKRPDIITAHPALHYLEPRRARRGIAIPIHPGAEKYYFESLGNGSEDC